MIVLDRLPSVTGGLRAALVAIGLTGLLGCDGPAPTSPTESETSSISVPPVIPTSCPGYAVPNRCPPFPTGGANVISGTAFERTAAGTTPVRVTIWPWVQRDGNGYAGASVSSAADGSFTIPTLPDGTIVLKAWGSYDQPCASIVNLNQATANATIEVVSQAAPIADRNPPQPAVTGAVYELVNGVRVPIKGARIYFDISMEVYAAVTTTDDEGRYSLCRLPTTASYIEIWRDGYQTKYQRVQVSGLLELDIEMKQN